MTLLREEVLGRVANGQRVLPNKTVAARFVQRKDMKTTLRSEIGFEITLKANPISVKGKIRCPEGVK